MVIETLGLRRRFGSKVAVADLSLAVREGEVFGFLGPNGAGKTTSLKMLLGLLSPSGGTGRVLGAPLGNVPARAGIGFLPEHFRFHDWLTGRDFLHYHGRLYGLRGPALRERVEELLERVDLADSAGRRIGGYSKGMLQRVGLAQALLNRPRLVFLDEPTSGLDPIGRLLVRDIIREARGQGTTVFLNSHLLGEVEATCDRVVFMKAGRAIRELQLGTGDQTLEVELKLGPHGAQVREGLARFGHGLSGPGDTLVLRMEREEDLPRLARWVIEQGVDLYRMQARRRSLEELFLEVMGDDQRPG